MFVAIRDAKMPIIPEGLAFAPRPQPYRDVTSDRRGQECCHDLDESLAVQDVRDVGIAALSTFFFDQYL